MKFKIGDTVRKIKNEGKFTKYDGNVPIGTIGICTYTTSTLFVFTTTDHSIGYACCDYDNYELISENPIKERSVSRNMTHENNNYHEGDKIQVTANCSSNEVGKTYTVGMHMGKPYAIVSIGLGCQCYSNWKLISCVKDNMANINKLTKAQKEAWGKDQQALYQVGINDANGELTNDSVVVKALARVMHKALVTQAEADIKEQEDLDKENKSK